MNFWPMTRPDLEVFDPVTQPGQFDGSSVSGKNSKLRVNLICSSTDSRRDKFSETRFMFGC